MRDKNGIQMMARKTTCTDGDECTCHCSAKLCNVCRDLGCKKEYGR